MSNIHFEFTRAKVLKAPRIGEYCKTLEAQKDSHLSRDGKLRDSAFPRLEAEELYLPSLVGPVSATSPLSQLYDVLPNIFDTLVPDPLATSWSLIDHFYIHWKYPQCYMPNQIFYETSWQPLSIDPIATYLIHHPHSWPSDSESGTVVQHLVSKFSLFVHYFHTPCITFFLRIETDFWLKLPKAQPELVRFYCRHFSRSQPWTCSWTDVWGSSTHSGYS